MPEGRSHYGCGIDTCRNCYDDPKCEICGEPVRQNEEAAEMYHPDEPQENSLFCHAQCGLNNGMEIS